MARIRTIKPELAQDLKLASTSRDARYTFILLITQADDEGLIPGAHRQLLGLLYPHNDDVTAAQLLHWIEELESIGAIRWRATVDGAPVIELTNWSKHQRVDNKGKSHLAATLADPAATNDILAASRREPPQVAESRGLDLGPRTLDPPSPRKAAAGRKAIRTTTPTDQPPFALGPYLDAYTDVFPGSKPPAGQFGKVLKPLDRQHGPVETLRRWRIFVPQKGRFGVEYFARTWSDWSGDPPDVQSEAPRQLRATEQVIA